MIGKFKIQKFKIQRRVQPSKFKVIVRAILKFEG